MKNSEFKVLGKTIEEFLIHWNAITFQLGGLSESFAEKLSHIYITELKRSLKALKDHKTIIKSMRCSRSSCGGWPPG